MILGENSQTLPNTGLLIFYIETLTMKFLIIFLSYFTLCNNLIYSQNSDTTKVWHLKQEATKLYETYRYDSAAHYYFQVAEIYTQQKKWINSIY